MLQICVLVVGLDNSGKSTIVNRLKVPSRWFTCITYLVCYTNQTMTTAAESLSGSGYGAYGGLFDRADQERVHG